MDDIQHRILNHNSNFIQFARKLTETINQPITLHISGDYIPSALRNVACHDYHLTIQGIAINSLTALIAPHWEIKPTKDIHQQILVSISNQLAVTITTHDAPKSPYHCLQLLACPFTGKIFDHNNALDKLSMGLLEIEQSATTADVYNCLLLVARYNLTLDHNTQKLLYNLTNQINFNEMEVEHSGQVFHEILTQSEHAYQAFTTLKLIGLRYRHFRFLLNLERAERERRWEEAVVVLQRVSKISQELKLNAEEREALHWIAFLQTLLEHSQSKNIKAASKTSVRLYRPIVEIVSEKIPLSVELISLISRGISMLTLLRRQKAEITYGQTTVVKMTADSDYSIENPTTPEQSSAMLNNEVAIRLRQLAPIPLALSRALVAIGNPSLAFHDQFFQDLSF